MNRIRTTELIRGTAEAPRLIGGVRTGSGALNSDVRETPDFRETAEPTIEVVLSATAGERIADDLFALVRSDGKECGGYLFGPKFYGLDKSISVTSATRTWDATRADDSLCLDSAAWLATEQAIAREGREEEMIGSWHCHPATFDRRPSRTDLGAWLSMRDFFERRRWSSEAHIGLIYSAGRDTCGESTWARPEVSAWIVKRDKWRGPVCEPAKLTERR